jgi:hypothetical protein
MKPATDVILHDITCYIAAVGRQAVLLIVEQFPEFFEGFDSVACLDDLLATSRRRAR